MDLNYGEAPEVGLGRASMMHMESGARMSGCCGHEGGRDYEWTSLVGRVSTAPSQANTARHAAHTSADGGRDWSRREPGLRLMGWWWFVDSY